MRLQLGLVILEILGNRHQPRLEELSDHRGHFRVDDDRRFLVKCTGNCNPPWNFTVREEERSLLKFDRLYSYHTEACPLLVLNCGNQKLCALQRQEWRQVLDEAPNAPDQQVITVDHEPGREMGVTSTVGDLEKRVPASRFPSVLFD